MISKVLKVRNVDGDMLHAQNYEISYASSDLTF
jgi:hypothetical protein